MQARIVNSEGLSPEQAALAQRYLDLAGAKGVRVGALIGDAAWDVRPLFLVQGTMTVLRFFPPGLFSSRDAWSQAQRVLAEAATEKSLDLVFGEAEVEGRSRLLWYRRKLLGRRLKFVRDLPIARSGQNSGSSYSRNMQLLPLAVRCMGIFVRVMLLLMAIV
jgi:hypothetical protein